MDDKFIERMDADLTGWADPVARLREALENDEFALYCQPIVALAGKERYAMAEVLVRLREEETAMLPPGEFLPVFEHYRMMPQLDRWVVRRLAQRLARGSRVPRFSINLSRQTLDDPDFPAHFADEMKAAGVPPASVVFEIEESIMLARPQPVARFAAAIRSAGGGLLIDSFGRKAVSFTPLKTLQLDFVKIDGSIVRKLLTSELARTKLSAVLRVGQAVGFGVIAECVEEQEVLARLVALGVDYAQGFGIYPPQPIDVLAA